MKKIAYLFPGQGSQKVGMGKDLYASGAAARSIFDLADDVTGLPVSRLCFEGPMEALTETIHLQPAVTAVNLALLSILAGEKIVPALCAGHSLGEYSALCAAGVVSERDALKLVFRRGELMHREATRHQGAMSAIVGLSIDQVREAVAHAAPAGIVAVANHNSADQIVITGEPAAVQAAGEKAAALGGRAVSLKVSGAWHSPLIQGAESDFRQFLGTIAFGAPQLPLIHNVTADVETDPAAVRELMARQLCSPVRWYDCMRRMMDAGVDAFVEIGPGRVLSGLLKKILPPGHSAQVYNVYDLKTLEAFLAAAGARG